MQTTRRARSRRHSVGLSILIVWGVAACASSRPGANSHAVAPGANASPTPPAYLLGDFEDDYGARFTISSSEFFQRARNRFHIVQWNVRDQFFIAQNDSLNPSDPNKWTRIDWLPLTGMTPFEWAFCFSAYKADNRAEAEAASTAKRDTPKTGCNGFPFSRMKRITGSPK